MLQIIVKQNLGVLLSLLDSDSKGNKFVHSKDDDSSNAACILELDIGVIKDRQMSDTALLMTWDIGTFLISFYFCQLCNNY